ncbi:MAG TPA: hypothetical protein VMM84_07865 [Pyrinomonadaceae bacterium]|nr:hypothetical protein [Pyrinomonadaceae bacterium]
MRSVMCRRCFTEPGWNAHEPSEIRIDDFQSNRSFDETYRTSFLRGLFAHMKRGFYHDGRFATSSSMVEIQDRSIWKGDFEKPLRSFEIENFQVANTWPKMTARDG